MTITVACDVLGEENNGTTIAAMNLIRSLRSKGYNVRILCPDVSRRGEPGVYVVPQLNVGPLNGYVRRNGVSIAKADRDIVEAAVCGASVVHIMTPFILGTAALHAAKRHGIPVTAGFHCQAENLTNHLFLMNSQLANKGTYRAFYQYFYRHVDAVHYPTQFIRDVFEREGGPTNAYVISNGVNKSFVRREKPRPAELEGKYILLFTGRYSKEKSHRVLLDGVAQSHHADRIQLIFAGDGPQKAKLMSYAAELPILPPIFRFFSREDMIDAINWADLYVHPAEIEIEAISCLEAITCGVVPIIADSERSATRYFALDEKNLFHVNDPADLARRIDYWLDHPAESQRRSEEYLGYTKQFDQDLCMDRMEQMLLDTIERGSCEVG